jgi:hypothetical protein
LTIFIIQSGIVPLAGQNHKHCHIEELNHEVERRCQEIDDAVMHAMPNFNIDNIPEEVQRHMIFDSLSGRGQLYVVTGFTEDEIN